MHIQNRLSSSNWTFALPQTPQKKITAFVLSVISLVAITVIATGSAAVLPQWTVSIGGISLIGSVALLGALFVVKKPTPALQRQERVEPTERKITPIPFEESKNSVGLTKEIWQQICAFDISVFDLGRLQKVCKGFNQLLIDIGSEKIWETKAKEVGLMVPPENNLWREEIVRLVRLEKILRDGKHKLTFQTDPSIDKMNRPIYHQGVLWEQTNAKLKAFNLDARMPVHELEAKAGSSFLYIPSFKMGDKEVEEQVLIIEEQIVHIHGLLTKSKTSKKLNSAVSASYYEGGKIYLGFKDKMEVYQAEDFSKIETVSVVGGVALISSFQGNIIFGCNNGNLGIWDGLTTSTLLETVPNPIKGLVCYKNWIVAHTGEVLLFYDNLQLKCSLVIPNPMTAIRVNQTLLVYIKGDSPSVGQRKNPPSLKVWDFVSKGFIQGYSLEPHLSFSVGDLFIHRGTLYLAKGGDASYSMISSAIES